MNRRSGTDEIAEIIVAYSTAGHFGHSREPPIASLFGHIERYKEYCGMAGHIPKRPPPTPSDLELLPAAG
jgi:hypothetical protein